MFVSRTGGVIKKGVWAPDFGNPDIFGSVQFSCYTFVEEAFLQLQPDRTQLNARKHQDLNTNNIPTRPGDSSELFSNWEWTELIPSRASVNTVHEMGPCISREWTKEYNNPAESMK